VYDFEVSANGLVHSLYDIYRLDVCSARLSEMFETRLHDQRFITITQDCSRRSGIPGDPESFSSDPCSVALACCT
jgi:hypothetical protein